MAKKMVTIGAVELRKINAKLAAEERKKAKKALRRTDGLSPFLSQRYVQALRKVWRDSSEARKICVKRSALAGGYSRCEKCKKKVPKIFVDHIVPCGALGPGYIERLSVSSAGLQALCDGCHKVKTKDDNARTKRASRKVFTFDDLED